MPSQFKEGVADLRDLSTFEGVLSELTEPEQDRILANARADALSLLRFRETHPPVGRASGKRLMEWIETQTYREGDTQDHCWVFPWRNPTSGYPEIYLPNKKGDYTPVPVHRTYYKLSGAEIPPFHVLVHICANKQCIRPSHMLLEERRPGAGCRKRYGKGKKVGQAEQISWERVEEDMKNLDDAALAKTIARLQAIQRGEA